ncbi:MAG: hypothetical protein LBP37_01695 [Spirochaetaceae bacterium]|jgi:tetratricopeptide (TPR) repeat protein|nr:hypothetical protein [Spirochaetaceae bacterium]
MRKMLTALVLGLGAAVAWAAEPPDWFTPLRDAVYGSAGDAAYAARLGGEVEERAKRELDGTELLNMLSYCEFLIAKAYMAEKDDSVAEARFQNGFNYADSSVKDKPSSNAYRMMAENLSQLCTLKPTAWVIANGLKVERYAKKGLEYDKRNGACAFLIASRWVYAPAPFSNVKKGIADMKKILSGAYDLQKEDYFNVYYSIAYGYNRNKQTEEVKPWLEKALAIYPENKNALDFIQGKARIADSLKSLDAVGIE